MAPKSKSHKKTLRSEKTVQTVSPTFLSAWRGPLLSASFYHGEIAAFGFGLTGITLIAVMIFFMVGHTVRPRVFGENLVTKLLHPERYENFTALAANPNQMISKGEIQGEEAVYLHVDPGPISGFAVPTRFIQIPKGAKKVGLTMNTAYKGDIYLRYGFAQKNSTFKDVCAKESGVRLECYPSPNALRKMILLPEFFSENDLQVSWEDAEFFYLLIGARKPTDIYLIRIALLEK